MKLKKIAIMMLTLLVFAALVGSALAATRIDTDEASLAAANASEAAAGQSGTVDGVINFDYNGKTYVYYHMNDGGSGYFLPVTYMQEALDAAFSLSTPSENVQGYQKALEAAMSQFLGSNAATQSEPAPATASDAVSSDALFADEGSTFTSTAATSNGGYYDDSKDDPYGALTNSGKKKSGSTPELGDESLPIYALAAIAALSLAGMAYARKRGMEG